MKTFVRTTITVPFDLLEAARAAAFYRKTTLSDVIRQGLRKAIAADEGKSIKATKSASFVGRHTISAKAVRREDIYARN